MRVHFLGICGTFMAGLALVARALGHRVSGSDANAWPPMSTQLEEAGIDVIRGYEPAQLEPAPDLVVVGNVMTRGNPCVEYLLERRQKLGGFLPVRRSSAPKLKGPSLDAFKTQIDGSGDREISTTMALVRMLTTLVKDKNIGDRIVPIVPDEARTFGMEGMFRQIGIYSSRRASTRAARSARGSRPRRRTAATASQ